MKNLIIFVAVSPLGVIQSIQVHSGGVDHIPTCVVEGEAFIFELGERLDNEPFEPRERRRKRKTRMATVKAIAGVPHAAVVEDGLAVLPDEVSIANGVYRFIFFRHGLYEVGEARTGFFGVLGRLLEVANV